MTMKNNSSEQRTSLTGFFQNNLVLGIVCLIMGSSPVLAADKNADKNYEKALQTFHNGETDAALIHLKNALKAEPKHLPAHILMAEILISQGNGAMAEIELDYARDKGADPNRLIVLYGTAYQQQDKFERLLEAVRPGKRGNNTEANIAFLRGQAYFALKKLANAGRSFDNALKLNPSLYKAKLGRAKIASTRKFHGKAMRLVDSALEDNQTDPTIWIMKSRLYKVRGFSGDSMDAINRALELDETHLDARLVRSALFMGAKDYVNAEKDVDYILGRIPNEPRAKYLKASIRATSGNFSDSFDKMNEVVQTLQGIPAEVKNNNPSYYYIAGLTNYRLGKLERARENLNMYLKFEKSDMGARRLLGALELQAGEPLTASVVLIEAYRAQPKNPTIMTLLGMAYLNLGNTKKANDLFGRVVKILPESSQSLTNLARGHMAAGSFDDAIQNLLKAEQHNLNSVSVKLLLAETYQKSNQFDKALAILGGLQAQFPEDSYFHQLHGTALGRSGDHKAAREKLEKALTLDKNNITALIHLARMDVVQKKPDRALDRLQKKLKQMPGAYSLMLEIGDIYKFKNDLKKTLFWYEKSYSLNSNNFTALGKIVSTQLALKDESGALSRIESYTDSFPEDDRVYVLLGNLHFAANRQEEAVKAFKLAANYATNRGEALMRLANIQRVTSDNSGAKASLLKAIAWDPELVNAFIALIKMNIQDKDEKNALQMIKSIAKLTKGSPTAPLLKGELYLTLGKYRLSEKSYLNALKTGDAPLAIVGLYSVYKNTGQIDKAIRRIEAWYKKYPEDLTTATLLGNAYEHKGNLKKAVSHYKSLLERAPDSALLLNNTANVLFDLGEQGAAFDYAQKALEKAPNNVGIMDTLAWIEARRGNPDIALPLLRKAVALNFNEPEIKYHLAITLDMLERRSEALKIMAEVTGERKFNGQKDARNIYKKWLKEK